LFLLQLLVRARAWQNISRVAFPGADPGYKVLAATYLVGAGANAIIPAKAGEAIKLFLARHEIKGSSYPALASTLVSMTLFDVSAGLIILALALQLGVLESLPFPQLDWYWLLAATVFLSFIGMMCSRLQVVKGLAVKIKQGFEVLRQPLFYLRSVASWQALGLLFQTLGFALLLNAFGVESTAANVFLALSVTMISTAIPFAPGGAGTQQALLIATLAGAPSTVLTYAVSAQVAVTAAAVLWAALSMGLVFKTLDWKSLRSKAKNDLEYLEVPTPLQSSNSVA